MKFNLTLSGIGLLMSQSLKLMALCTVHIKIHFRQGIKRPPPGLFCCEVLYRRSGYSITGLTLGNLVRAVHIAAQEILCIA